MLSPSFFVHAQYSIIQNPLANLVYQYQISTLHQNQFSTLSKPAFSADFHYLLKSNMLTKTHPEKHLTTPLTRHRNPKLDKCSYFQSNICYARMFINIRPLHCALACEEVARCESTLHSDRAFET